jgi:hypothetical protein
MEIKEEEFQGSKEEIQKERMEVETMDIDIPTLIVEHGETLMFNI